MLHNRWAKIREMTLSTTPMRGANKAIESFPSLFCSLYAGKTRNIIVALRIKVDRVGRIICMKIVPRCFLDFRISKWFVKK